MAVRRTKAHVETHPLGHVRFYREDLVEIAKALAEVGPLKTECDGMVGDSPNDFSDKLMPKYPEHLVMSSSVIDQATIEATEKLSEPLREAARRPEQNGAIEVTLSKRRAVVTLIEPNMLTAGVLSRIQQLADVRRRPLTPKPVAASATESTSLQDASLIVIAALAVMTGLIAAISAWSEAFKIGLITAFVVSAPIQAVVAFWVTIRRRTSAVIINGHKDENPTFWQRHRITVISTTIGTLFGGIVGYLVNQIPPLNGQ